MLNPTTTSISPSSSSDTSSRVPPTRASTLRSGWLLRTAPSTSAKNEPAKHSIMPTEICWRSTPLSLASSPASASMSPCHLRIWSAISRPAGVARTPRGSRSRNVVRYSASRLRMCRLTAEGAVLRISAARRIEPASMTSTRHRAAVVKMGIQYNCSHFKHRACNKLFLSDGTRLHRLHPANGQDQPPPILTVILTVWRKR